MGTNVAYPVVDSDRLQPCSNKNAVLEIEEGRPDHHGQAMHAVLDRADRHRRAADRF